MTTKYVVLENEFKAGNIALNDPTGGTVTIQDHGYVVSPSGSGFTLAAAPWTVQVDGTIFTQNGALDFDGGAFKGSSKLTVGVEGMILSTSATAVTLGVPASVTNSGLIEGSVGIVVEPTITKAVTITNNATGTIAGGSVAINSTGLALLTIKNQGDIDGLIRFGALNLTNSGTIDGAHAEFGTLGFASITNSGEISGNALLTNQADSVKNTGEIGGLLDMVAGNNQLTNGGTILGSVLASSGDDKVKNTGTIDDLVNLGAGKNNFSNTGTIAMTFASDGGDDTFTNSGTIGDSVTLGGGLNKATNSGNIEGNLAGGGENDVFTNAKTILGDVLLGDGTNSLTNGGTIAGSVTGGSGSDTFKNTGTVGVSINLGGGDDTMTGGNSAEDVTDSLGIDTYKLGGGNDRLMLQSGNDICDGGAGQDTLSLSLVVADFRVNLDTKAVTLYDAPFQASSAVAASAGIDASVKGFEKVVGGSGSDWLMGSGKGDFLDGGVGSDVLYGGLGNDTLTGSAGTDYFSYQQTKESGPTRDTRDTITDFAGAGAAGGDWIDLKAMDADTTKDGDQAFAWYGNMVSFDPGFAGLLRTVVLGDDVLVQGEVNGDGKVDFEILVVGAPTLYEFDFIL